MKALVAYAPMPLLIALGIKGIETKTAPPNGDMRPEGVRGAPGCAVDRGERVAFVLGKTVWSYDEFPEAWDRLAEAMAVPMFVTGRLLADLFAHATPEFLYQRTGHRLGSVVCTATVTGALPVRDPWDDDPGVWPPEHPCIVPTGRFDDLSAVQVAPGSYAPTVARSGERPLGDFTPGRWGWLLADPVPCTPVPCKGRQGVFQLPENVAEQVTAQSPRENRNQP